MSIRTRLRALESTRRKANAGFSLIRDNHDGSFNLDEVCYPDRAALDRMMKGKPGHLFHISHVPEPDPLPPELAPHRPRRGPSS